jgi:hypothetical protein
MEEVVTVSHKGFVDVDEEHGSITQSQEKGNTPKRAKWIHQRKLFLIQLLNDHDVLGFRTQNSWSKEAWNNIVRHLNKKFGTSYTLGQVKQKEQDLKKDYWRVKDLLEQSGFGWNSDRMMVEAPESIWASFARMVDRCRHMWAVWLHQVLLQSVD